MRTAQLQRINVLWFLTLGVTALAAGILVYILLLESALGAFSIQDATPILFGDHERAQVLIHDGATSRDRYAELYRGEANLARYDSAMVSWERIVNLRLDEDFPAIRLDDDALSAGHFGQDAVLVFPASLALDEVQREQVRSFLNDGGSVLVSWAAGLYNANGDWTGWDFMEDLFGLEFDAFVESGPDAFSIWSETFPGTAPEGMYIPRYRYDAIEESLVASHSALENATRREQIRRAAASDFQPLRDYVWYDSLDATPPAFDFASVHHVATASPSDLAADSVMVSYYTFVGVDEPSNMPYPRTDGHTRRFTLRSNTPLTAGIPGGYRAKIQVYSPGVNMRITDADRAVSAGFWYDFATDESRERDPLNPESGLVYGRVGSGRFVVMGFGPDALGASEGDPEDKEVLARLYDNVLAYLRRDPTAWTHDWPDGQTAAFMLGPSVGVGAVGVREMIEFFDREGIPGTFFVQAPFARQFPSAVRQMVGHGEVGLLDPSDGSDGTSSVRATRISGQKQQLEEITRNTVYGYRNGQSGQYARDVMSSLSAADFSYFLPDSIGRRTTPKIMGAPFESLTRMGVSTKDSDLALLSDTVATPRERERQLLAEAYRVFDEGGLYHIRPSSSVFSDVSRSTILRSVVERIRLERVWFATGSEIAHWWRLRKGLNADVEQRSPSRIFVRVSNDNGDTAEHATVSIALGRAVTSVKIKPELINLLKQAEDEITIPPHRLSADGTVLELTIKQLKPQQYRIFHIDLFSDELAERFARN